MAVAATYRHKTEPPAAAVLPSETIQSPGGGADADAAWLDAVANIGSFTGVYTGGTPLADGEKYNQFATFDGEFGGSELEGDVVSGTANFGKCRYKIPFYTATGYFKAQWAEVVRDELLGGSEIGRVSKEFEWTGEPPVGFDEGDSTTWNESDVYDMDAAEPPAPAYTTGVSDSFEHYSKTVEDFRYSFVPAYVPPTDGSANGFPV